MPIYEYRCERCGHQLEAIQKYVDDPLTDCPACGEADLRRLVSAAAFHLKGSGWYATDFKDKPKAKDKAGEEAGKTGEATADKPAKADTGKTEGGTPAKEAASTPATAD